MTLNPSGRPLSRIEEEVLVSVAEEYARADGTCSNPDCPGRSGHDGPCWQAGA